MKNTLQKPKFGLTNNQLKIIAMVSMLLDHVGLVLFDDVMVFRYIGRLAFPIFAYMIAEGCRYTKNRARYLGMIAGMAVIFQAVFFVAMDSLYQGILVTFSLAIITIYAIDGIWKSKKLWVRLASVGALAFVAVFLFVLPRVLTGTDFDIDYGAWGIIIPVAVYFIPKHPWRVGCVGILLLIRAIHYAVIGVTMQWWSLACVPLLALYNGERGRAKMKYVFYIFYPVHLVIVYGIAMLIEILK